MAYNKFFAIFSFLCNLAVALTDCTVSCFKIEPATIAGVVGADVLLTIIIVIVTYQGAIIQRPRTENVDKVYMNVRGGKKS